MTMGVSQADAEGTKSYIDGLGIEINVEDHPLVLPALSVSGELETDQLTPRNPAKRSRHLLRLTY